MSRAVPATSPARSASGAAAYLDSTLIGDAVIGVSSWSASLLAAVEVMRPKRTQVADRVVQVVGGVGSPEVQMQATRLTGRLAELTGASPVFIPSPGLVGSRTLQQALMADPGVAAVRRDVVGAERAPGRHRDPRAVTAAAS